MTDVRLTATNPEDSSVVPVACNAKGELLLEEPLVPEFDGNVDGDLNVSGSATFANYLNTSHGYLVQPVNDLNYSFASRNAADTVWTSHITGNGDAFFAGVISANGSATFAGDVVIGSRNKQWMIVESNGLAHLVEQTRAVEMRATYPPLRDIPGELTMVEEQLQKVLEKLRMVPEAGWEVWDGSDTN